MVEIFQGAQHKPEFLALNPGGTVRCWSRTRRAIA